MLCTLLIISLPTRGTTARMRAWRALKGCGAAVLRDGVYALPAGAAHEQRLQAIGADVVASGGQATLVAGGTCTPSIEALFDRRAQYRDWLAEAHALRAALVAASGTAALADATRQLQRLRRAYEQLVAIDFLPGEPQRQAADALRSLDEALARADSPDEPGAASHALRRLDRRRYRGRLWATRRRPWVDRLASAWLIRRFIDPEARFLWLATPADCPPRAIGFDFDGATFSHAGGRVTFESLLAAFDLETAALLRLGMVVHALDAGGVQPPETAGVQRVLAGMREALTDDDQLMLAAAAVFEGLHVAFAQEDAS